MTKAATREPWYGYNASKEKLPTKVLPRIYCKVYSNGPHFSATKKDGYTCYVPENLALAMFLRAEFAKLDGLWGMDKMSAELERLVLAGAMDDPPKRKKRSVLDNALLNAPMSSNRALPRTRKMIEKESRRKWRKKK